MIQTLKVRHNMEVAHRLFEMEGKCQQIHGHSMWVVAEFEGHVNRHGVLLGMDFSEVKQQFRTALDTTYDHHLLLNEHDDIAKNILLPGLQVVPGDPTTENIARWIGEWCQQSFRQQGLHRVKVEVWETQTNSATWEARHVEGTSVIGAVS